MKVCIVTPSFPQLGTSSRGGVDTYTETLAKALLQKGIEVHVVIYSDQQLSGAPPAVPVRMHIAPLKQIPYFSTLFPGLIEARSVCRFLASLDQQEHFDVIEGMNDEGRMLFIARRFGRRFWMRFHSSLRQHIENKRQAVTWSARFSVWLDGVAARQSGNLVTHSQSHAREMAGEYKIPIGKIHIVPLAVEAPRARIVGANSPGQNTVAYIGTLDQRKGIDVFLKAIPLILIAQPAARFLIIGRDGKDSPAGSWKEWFEKQNVNSPILQQVDFRGFIADEGMPSLWNQITTVVVPSRYESFGLVVIEAFLRGIPVVATDGGALPEVTQDAALQVAAGDVNALAVGVTRLLNEPELAQRLITRGLQIYQDCYTSTRFADAVVSLYTNR